VKFVAEDFNRPKFIACLQIVDNEAVFKNGVNTGLFGKLTEQAVIMFRRYVDQYFHAVKTKNPLDSVSHRHTSVPVDQSKLKIFNVLSR